MFGHFINKLFPFCTIHYFGDFHTPQMAQWTCFVTFSLLNPAQSKVTRRSTEVSFLRQRVKEQEMFLSLFLRPPHRLYFILAKTSIL
jgi:hypothetical protein